MITVQTSSEVLPAFHIWAGRSTSLCWMGVESEAGYPDAADTALLPVSAPSSPKRITSPAAVRHPAAKQGQAQVQISARVINIWQNIDQIEQMPSNVGQHFVEKTEKCCETSDLERCNVDLENAAT